MKRDLRLATVVAFTGSDTVVLQYALAFSNCHDNPAVIPYNS